MQNKLVLKTISMKVIVMVSLLPSQSRTKILGFNHELSFNLTSFQKYVLMEVLGVGFFPKQDASPNIFLSGVPSVSNCAG